MCGAGLRMRCARLRDDAERERLSGGDPRPEPRAHRDYPRLRSEPAEGAASRSKHRSRVRGTGRTARAAGVPCGVGRVDHGGDGAGAAARRAVEHPRPWARLSTCPRGSGATEPPPLRAAVACVRKRRRNAARVLATLERSLRSPARTRRACAAIFEDAARKNVSGVHRRSSSPLLDLRRGKPGASSSVGGGETSRRHNPEARRTGRTRPTAMPPRPT